MPAFATAPLTTADIARHGRGARWSGQYGKGEMRIRRAVKRAEAEERTARHQTVITRIAADHNISVREARRIYASRRPVELAKAARRAAEAVPHAA